MKYLDIGEYKNINNRLKLKIRIENKYKGKEIVNGIKEPYPE
jgi:hypothetical protein